MFNIEIQRDTPIMTHIIRITRKQECTIRKMKMKSSI